MKAIHLIYEQGLGRQSRGYLDQNGELADAASGAMRIRDEDVASVIATVEREALVELRVEEVDSAFWTEDEYFEACGKLARNFMDQWEATQRIYKDGEHFILARTPEDRIMVLEWVGDGYRTIQRTASIYANVEEACNELAIAFT